MLRNGDSANHKVISGTSDSAGGDRRDGWRRFRAAIGDGRGRVGGGFTLIELLVVVSIIALLVSILLPALSQAREQAKRVVCMTQVKSMVAGVLMYSHEYNDCMPTWDLKYQTWLGRHTAAQPNLSYEAQKVGLGKLYPTYLDNGQAFFCPSQKRYVFENCAGEWVGSDLTWHDFSYGMESPMHGGTTSAYHLRGDLERRSDPVDSTKHWYEKILVKHPDWMIICDLGIFWYSTENDEPDKPINHPDKNGMPAYFSCGWADGRVSSYKVQDAENPYLAARGYGVWPDSVSGSSAEWAAIGMDAMKDNIW